MFDYFRVLKGEIHIWGHTRMSSDWEKKAGDRTRDQKRSCVCRTSNRRREEVHTHIRIQLNPNKRTSAVLYWKNISSNFNKTFFPMKTLKHKAVFQLHHKYTHTDTHSNQTWPNVNQIKAALVRETKGIVVLLCARLGMSDLITWTQPTCRSPSLILSLKTGTDTLSDRKH